MNAARQATIVAFYGEKPAALTRLIGLCHDKVKDALGEQFSPYGIEQIHATVIGIERVPGSALRNLNFQRYRKRSVEMDVLGFLKYLMKGSRIPFSAQVGGFTNRDYPFTSRSQRPYSRAFSIQGDKVVVIGWPGMERTPGLAKADELHESRLHSNVLNEIRLAAQAYGILHAYHQHPSDVDNDLYFRIGLLDSPQLLESTRHQVEADMRQFLGRERPVITQVGLSDLYLASYENDSLPQVSTKVWPIAGLELRDDLSGLFMNGLDES